MKGNQIMDMTNTAEIIVKQSKNTINSMENLKRHTTKNDQIRSNLFEKFCANEHSLRVYSYMDADIGQSTEVKTFMEKVALFGGNFIGVNTDFETVVDKKEVQTAFQEAISTFNTMARKLEFENEVH
jgi:hypothetical protein